VLFWHNVHSELLIHSALQSSAKQLRLASKRRLQQHANESTSDNIDDNTKYELANHHNFNDKRRKLKYNYYAFIDDNNDFAVVDNYFSKHIRACSRLLFHELGTISSCERTPETRRHSF